MKVATRPNRLADVMDALFASPETWSSLDGEIEDPGAVAFSEKLDNAISRTLAPPPKLSLEEWAERYAYLSKENSSSPGKWRSFPYQRGIMQAITDPSIETVVWQKSARVGYTSILKHVIGYYAHQDPSPMLMVQPVIEDARGISQEEIDPLVKDTPVLRDIAISGRKLGSGVTVLKKKFTTGASLLLTGANSARGFRRITVRVVLFDEIDGYKIEGAQGGGSEGDQIKLGRKRTETFSNRKLILGSTPTVKGTSRIEREFNRSDKRYYVIPCAHCGGDLILKFSPKPEYGMEVTPPDGVKLAFMAWPKDKPSDAHFVCTHCGGVLEEQHKAGMISKGRWVATAESKGIAGFHIWAAYSLFGNAAWGKIAEEFVEVTRQNDIRELQVVVNTLFGETFEDQGERVDGSELYKRREDYGDIAPAQTVAVTAGVDVQGDRLEVLRVAWAPTGESWSLNKTVIYGDPTGADIWERLHDVLSQPVQHELGHEMQLLAAAVDSGYLTSTVTKWCAGRWARRWFAVKGQAGWGRPVWPKKPTKTKDKYQMFIIGIDEAKEMLYRRLRLTESGPGYCHFNLSFDEDHFRQLTSEEVKVTYERGLPVRRWQLKEGFKRNEALDITVYAMAAYESAKMMGFSPARKRERMIKVKESEGNPTETPREAQARRSRPVQSKRVVRSRFMRKRSDNDW